MSIHSQIWEDILGFENCEFYIKRWPQLVGMQFEDVLISFPDAVPCGIKMASYGGKIILNPDDCYVLQEGDEVIVIAEDDDTYTPAPLPKVTIYLYNRVHQLNFAHTELASNVPFWLTLISSCNSSGCGQCHPTSYCAYCIEPG